MQAYTGSSTAPKRTTSAGARDASGQVGRGGGSVPVRVSRSTRRARSLDIAWAWRCIGRATTTPRQSSSRPCCGGHPITWRRVSASPCCSRSRSTTATRSHTSRPWPSRIRDVRTRRSGRPRCSEPRRPERLVSSLAPRRRARSGQRQRLVGRGESTDCPATPQRGPRLARSRSQEPPCGTWLSALSADLFGWSAIT